MNYKTLLYEQAGHVVTLTYNRPDQHNAINRTMNAELHHAWERFRDDDDAFVLVITGAGETTFCAGWDLQDAADLSEIGDYDAFRVSLHNSPGECGYTRKADIFNPVIAAVNGYAFAAGLETALLADIRIAAENAEFGALERRWNIVGGDGMTVRLPLVVGFAKAMELVITGRRIGVQEAQQHRPRERDRAARSGARARAAARTRDRRAAPGSDPQRQGEHHARRRTHARGTPANRGRDGDLDVHAARSPHARSGGVQGGQPHARVATSRALAPRCIPMRAEQNPPQRPNPSVAESPYCRFRRASRRPRTPTPH